MVRGDLRTIMGEFDQKEVQEVNDTIHLPTQSARLGVYQNRLEPTVGNLTAGFLAAEVGMFPGGEDYMCFQLSGGVSQSENLQ